MISGMSHYVVYWTFYCIVLITRTIVDSFLFIFLFANEISFTSASFIIQIKGIPRFPTQILTMFLSSTIVWLISCPKFIQNWFSSRHPNMTSFLVNVTSWCPKLSGFNIWNSFENIKQYISYYFKSLYLKHNIFGKNFCLFR